MYASHRWSSISFVHLTFGFTRACSCGCWLERACPKTAAGSSFDLVSGNVKGSLKSLSGLVQLSPYEGKVLQLLMDELEDSDISEKVDEGREMD